MLALTDDPVTTNAVNLAYPMTTFPKKTNKISNIDVNTNAVIDENVNMTAVKSYYLIIISHVRRRSQNPSLVIIGVRIRVNVSMIVVRLREREPTVRGLKEVMFLKKKKKTKKEKKLSSDSEKKKEKKISADSDKKSEEESESESS